LSPPGQPLRFVREGPGLPGTTRLAGTRLHVAHVPPTSMAEDQTTFLFRSSHSEELGSCNDQIITKAKMLGFSGHWLERPFCAALLVFVH